MSNVKANSNGSGMWSTQTPAKPHLISGPGGLAAEVNDVRRDLTATLSPEICTTLDEWDGPGVGNTLILSMIPKTRQGTTLIHREVMDGALISPVTGTMTQPGGPGTPWQYNPATAPNASTPAVVTGSADMSNPALYFAPANGQLPSTPGTLSGLTLILTVNGKYGVLTFNSPVNPLNPPYPSATVLNPPLTILQVIEDAFPGVIASLSAASSPAYLVLTDRLSGTTQTVVVGAGTANALLGLTPGSTAGTGHSYFIEYEYDGTLVPNGTTSVTGGPPYVNNYQGP